MSDGSSTASSAQEKCEDMGAMLVSINNEDELNFIKTEVLRGRTLSAFIGGSDNEEGNECSGLS